MEIRFVLDISKDLKDTINGLSRSLLAIAPQRVETAANVQESPQQAAVAQGAQETAETTSEPENATETQNKTPRKRAKKAAPAESPASYTQVDASKPANAQESPQHAVVEQEAQETTETTSEPENAPETQASAFSDEGKGATGEELAMLSSRALAELADDLEAGNRLRAYCAKIGLLIPTIPTLIQAVGYDMAMAICRGEVK